MFTVAATKMETFHILVVASLVAGAVTVNAQQSLSDYFLT